MCPPVTLALELVLPRSWFLLCSWERPAQVDDRMPLQSGTAILSGLHGDSASGEAARPQPAQGGRAGGLGSGPDPIEPPVVSGTL